MTNEKYAAPAQAVAVPQVFPLQGDESDEDDLSPWQAGDSKPATEGPYLRDFDEGMAISWFSGGEWTRDGFFASDIQDAPWRGLSKPAAPAQEHATQLAGQGQDLIGIAETWEQSADDAEACKSERSQPDYNEGLVAGMRQCAADLRAAAPVQAQEDARDLEWLTKEGRAHGFRVGQIIEGAVITHSTESLRAAIDAARATQGGA